MMAPSTIRKAIGAVKDQTSISLAKLAGSVAHDLKILIVKATTHDNEPTDEKYVREILNMMLFSRGCVSACVFAISKRLSKTRNWIVALKALMLVHRLLNDGDPVFGQEVMCASRNGAKRILNMSDFRDEAHSSSWDHTGFIKNYAVYLDQKLECMVCEKKLFEDSYGDSNELRKKRNEVTPVKEMDPGEILEKLNRLLQLLERLLACRPTGAAKNTRIVLVAVRMLVKESFKLYFDMYDALTILFDRFLELAFCYSVKTFDAFVNASKKIDELVKFYSWCQDIGVMSPSEFPEVHKLSDELLLTLEGLLREKGNSQNNTKKHSEEILSATAIQFLPADQSPPIQQVNEDLVNLKDDRVSADEQGDKLALSLFHTYNAWEEFSSDKETNITSAWQNEAAESGRADWEIALVESASNLLKQKADLAGGFDSLTLNGMYDQGTVRQHVNNSQLNDGSASSVALPGTLSKSCPTVLALPAPDGTVQRVGQQDPFAASLLVAPPTYVQIADMERKQQWLVHEQRVWQQYAGNGMQGMPQVNGLGQPGGYYSTPY